MCLQVTGDVQDLTSLIDTFIPEGGVCCGTSDMSVQIDNAGTSTVTVADDFYGLFVGSVNSSDTGTAGILNWVSAVYGSPLSIDLTNADNVITDALFNVGSSLANTSAPTTSAPEPTSIALLCAALFGVGFRSLEAAPVVAGAIGGGAALNADIWLGNAYADVLHRCEAEASSVRLHRAGIPTHAHSHVQHAPVARQKGSRD